jgi:hypothetical protein
MFSVTLGEEHKFDVVENKVQRKMSGAEKNEGGDKFRILCCEEIFDLYRLCGIVSVKQMKEL